MRLVKIQVLFLCQVSMSLSQPTVFIPTTANYTELNKPEVIYPTTPTKINISPTPHGQIVSDWLIKNPTASNTSASTPLVNSTSSGNSSDLYTANVTQEVTVTQSTSVINPDRIPQGTTATETSSRFNTVPTTSTEPPRFNTTRVPQGTTTTSTTSSRYNTAQATVTEPSRFYPAPVTLETSIPDAFAKFPTTWITQSTIASETLNRFSTAQTTQGTTIPETSSKVNIAQVTTPVNSIRLNTAQAAQETTVTQSSITFNYITQGTASNTVNTAQVSQGTTDSPTHATQGIIPILTSSTMNTARVNEGTTAGSFHSELFPLLTTKFTSTNEIVSEGISTREPSGVTEMLVTSSYGLSAATIPPVTNLPPNCHFNKKGKVICRKKKHQKSSGNRSKSTSSTNSSSSSSSSEE